MKQWLNRLLGRKAAVRELTYDQIADLLGGGGGGSVAGVHVNEKTALQVATVLACVKTIADGCATPNLHVYRELPDGTRERATNIPEYRLLARRPNEWQTSFEWRRQMTLHAALTGSALSLIVRGDNYRVRELIPVMPGQWDVRRVSRYDLRYRIWDKFGQVGEFESKDVFLLQGLQWDWADSLNAMRLARSAIGLALATERSQASIHENGLRPFGLYSVDGNLTTEQYDRLTAWLKRKTGPDSAGAPLVLDRSAKWIPTTISGQDAQSIETRRLQVEEICRAYGVFPIMVGHSDKSATFASSEAFFAAHVKHTLAPWHKAWTQRIDEMLLAGDGALFAEFDARYLMIGSMKDRAVWARTMAEMGIYTRNELRDEEGKDPIPGLDVPLTPLNMAKLGEESEEEDATAEAKAIQRRNIQLSEELREVRAQIDALRNDAKVQPIQPMQVNVGVSTDQIAQMGREIRDTAERVMNQIRKDVQNMPIVIPAPNVTVEAIMPEIRAEMPSINVVNQVQPAPVTVTNMHPKRAVQTVERDANDEIIRTITQYED